jgi:RNA polymerase sigma-70 factor (ECF subfamily)
MTPASDETLATALRAGRRDAFETLYHEYSGPIYNLSARILGDREEAKDVTQEVFITAFTGLPSDEGLKLRAWLYRVASNLCFNRLRSRNRTDGGDLDLEALPAQVDSYAQAETVAMVESSLAGLEERQRAALVLKDLHGMPSQEIASVLEVSRSNADVLVHRARASFKLAFAKLAGDVPAPASLGLVLAPLAVPAALQTMPPLPHLGMPLHPVPGSHVPHGLLSKLATTATSKIAIGAAVASLAVGGGAIELSRVAHHKLSARAASALSISAKAVPASYASQPRGYWYTRYGCGEWSSRSGWRTMKSWSWHKSRGYTWSKGSWQAPRSSGGSWSDGKWSGSGGSGSGSWSSGSGSGSTWSQKSSGSSSGGSWSSGSGSWGGSSGGSGW